MKLGLTKRQNDVFHFLREHIEKNGFPPTIQEICNKFGFASTNGVSQLLQALEKKGYIERVSKGASRGIRILDDSAKKTYKSLEVQGAKNITLIGDGQSDNPLSVFLSPKGQMVIDSNFFASKGQLFGSVAEDDAMSTDGIFQGDIVIVLQQPTVKSGQIAVCLVHDMKYIRRYTQTPQYTELSAGSKGFPRMRFPEGDDSLAILGVVVGLIRKMR
jgi:repressor LexA